MRAIRDGMVLSPPLIVTEAQIDEIVDKARRSLDETLARGRAAAGAAASRADLGADAGHRAC